MANGDRWRDNRGMFGYEGEGYLHRGGRDEYERERDRGDGRDPQSTGNDAGGDRGLEQPRGGGYGGFDYNRGGYGHQYGNDRGANRPSFRGRGPKNYQRSDDRIREDVCERLEMDHDVDASELEVHVASGVVTLSGSVPDRRTKRLAEDIVESVNGVKEVQNQIHVAGRMQNPSPS